MKYTVTIDGHDWGEQAETEVHTVELTEQQAQDLEAWLKNPPHSIRPKKRRAQ